MRMCAIEMMCFAILGAISLAAAAVPKSEPAASQAGKSASIEAGKQSFPVYDPKTGNVPSPCYAVYTPAIPTHEIKGTRHHIHMKTNSASRHLGLRNMPVSFDTQRYAPGGYQEPARHPGTWQTLYVLEGEGEVRIGDAIYKLYPGTWFYVPVGEIHAARNTGKGDLVMLYVGGGTGARPPRPSQAAAGAQRPM